MPSLPILLAALAVAALAACGGRGATGHSMDVQPSVETAPEPADGALAPCNVLLPLDTRAYAELPGVDPNLLSVDIHGFDVPEAGCAPAPVVIYVHGGGWAIGDKANVASKDAYFTGVGYVFVSVNYRLSPNPPDRPTGVQHPVHVQDVARAVRWVVDHLPEYGGDPARVALLGHSAGAHLVALVATSPDYLSAVGLAPGDLRCVAAVDTMAFDIPAALATATSQQQELYENAFGTDPAVWTEASPITHVQAGRAIPSFLLVDRGTDLRADILERFRDALRTADVSVTTIDATGLSHRDVNVLIGDPTDDVVTPPLTEFFRGCLQ